MKTSTILFICGLSIVAVLAIISLIRLREVDSNEPSQVESQAAAVDISNFARVTAPRSFTFPMDHGPHPDYQTEWWYYTGNLVDSNDRRFGFQLTFFRRAMKPSNKLQDRESHWATSQVYMAHFAVSDINGNRFQAFERLTRGAAGLAGAQTQPYRVWLQDWQVFESSENQDQCLALNTRPCVYRLQASQGEISLDLTLTDTTGPTLQGDQGFSRKGAEIGQASYYYSLTRLATSGEIRLGSQEYAVTGWSWMDHEWSTSALSKEQVGWDWFSIQLDQGGQLMVFQIRREDRSVDPYSSGIWVHPDGSTQILSREDFSIEVGATWQSPHSGAEYPSQWNLVVPEIGLDINIQPYLRDQELNVSYAYWEGAVRVAGFLNGENVTGHGYVELTGYSGSMGGEF